MKKIFIIFMILSLTSLIMGNWAIDYLTQYSWEIHFQYFPPEIPGKVEPWRYCKLVTFRLDGLIENKNGQVIGKWEYFEPGFVRFMMLDCGKLKGWFFIIENSTILEGAVMQANPEPEKSQKNGKFLLMRNGKV